MAPKIFLYVWLAFLYRLRNLHWHTGPVSPVCPAPFTKLHTVGSRKLTLEPPTGYIGGDIFYQLYKAHPEYEYVLLVRNEERGRPVVEEYPKVRIVYGSLDDADVIEKEAAAADIVIRE